MNFGPVATSARRVFDITEALCRAVGNAIRPGFIQVAMAILVCRRIQRVRGLLLAIEARFLAGQVRRRIVGPVVADRVSAARVRPELAMPRRLGWLCDLVPGDAACFAGRLRLVLAEPEMVVLLGRCPQAVRVLMPLCRMLGIARAEFVPAGDIVVAAAETALARMGPGVGVAAPAVREASAGEALTGMGWVRFVSG